MIKKYNSLLLSNKLLIITFLLAIIFSVVLLIVSIFQQDAINAYLIALMINGLENALETIITLDNAGIRATLAMMIFVMLSLFGLMLAIVYKVFCSLKRTVFDSMMNDFQSLKKAAEKGGFTYE